MAYLRAFVRLVTRVVLVIAVLLVLYCAWWWEEIWIDAQAKHAHAMLEASQTCVREVAGHGR